MQQINFYNTLIKPSRYAIHAKRGSFIVLMWCGVLFVIFLVQLMKAVFNDASLTYFQHKQKTTTHALETLIHQSPKATQLSDLKKTIDIYNEKINHQDVFSKEIALYDAQNKAFQPSRYLHALAKVTVPHVWLTKIHFQNQGNTIQLQGYTYSASLLMQYVEKLQTEPDFSKKPFNKVNVVRSEDKEQLPFIISTEEDKK